MDNSSTTTRIRFCHTTSRRLFGLLVLFLCCVVTASGDERKSPLKSTPAVGSDVNSFYVRAVTGPLAGKSVCYVCRNGDRPVVAVFLRELTEDTTRLLKQLDAIVNEHRAMGLRCFAVLLSDSPQKDSARLQTLAFDEKIELPLTIAGESVSGSILGNLSGESATTIVLYDHLKVEECFCYRSSEFDESACKTVSQSARQLARRSTP